VSPRLDNRAIAHRRRMLMHLAAVT
jgi:hypothetical protein